MLKSKIIKNILLGISVLAIIGLVIGAFFSIEGTLSFLQDDNPSIPFFASSSSNFDGGNYVEKTGKRSFSLSDIEFHYQKKGFDEDHGDTIITLRYITLKNSRHQLNIGEKGLPLASFTGSETTQKVAYSRIESLQSIPFEKIDKNFWKTFLLSRIITSTLIYMVILSLIFSITKNAFKTTPFTYKIRNKLYFLAGFMLMVVLSGWIFNNILYKHLYEHFKIFIRPALPITWILMGVLMLFIATIFDYGIRLQEEQNLTI